MFSCSLGRDTSWTYINRSPEEYKTIPAAVQRSALPTLPHSPSPLLAHSFFCSLVPPTPEDHTALPTTMSTSDKKELDGSSVEKGTGKTIDFTSLHSGALPHTYPQADDELHFDERENDGVKRLLNQRHVQMFVLHSLSLSSCSAYQLLAPTGSP